MSKLAQKNINIQAGKTTITPFGVAPILVTLPDLETSTTAVVATPNENLNVMTAKLFPDIYLITATQLTVGSVEYLIVSGK